MLLAIDIGNTNITLGVWDGREWQLQWRLRTVPDKTTDEYGIYLNSLLRESKAAGKVDQVILASVVPRLNTTFANMCRRYLELEPLQVGADTVTGIRIATENPHEVGADRIVNAAAAYSLYAGPTIVIDMGTATTFDIISAAGELIGVAIAPGLQLAADALAQRAAQLSRVALQAPSQAIGRNTVEAMQSGCVFGYVALVEGLTRRLLAELEASGAGGQPVRVLGTGGLISLITPHTNLVHQVEPWLTLTGLCVINELNQARARPVK
jgi:type III pantothenate kinase